MRDGFDMSRVAAVSPRASTGPDVIELQSVRHLSESEDIGDDVGKVVPDGKPDAPIANAVTTQLPRPAGVRTTGLVNV